MKTDAAEKEQTAARLKRRIERLLVMVSAALGEPEDPEVVAARRWALDAGRAGRVYRP